MRRVVSLLLVLALATGLFTACGSSASSEAAPTVDENLSSDNQEAAD